MSLLLQQIKNRRKREKVPLEKSSFNIVVAIVEAYCLNHEFLEFLDSPPRLILKENGTGTCFREKPRLAIPIYPLSSKDNYLLAMEIVRAIDNPYLKFARAPEEIYLSSTLYLGNSSIPDDELESHHFEVLIRREISRGNLSLGL